MQSGQAWSAVTCYQILGQQVEIRATSPDLINWLNKLWRSFAKCESSNPGSGLLLSFVASKSVATPRYFVYRHSQLLGAGTEFWRLMRYLEWQLDIFLADNVTHHLLLHGGAVAKQGAGVLLPAVSGSGKSSVTLALVRRGFDYYTDDLVVVDPHTATLSAFPKPFSLKDPTLFPELTTCRRAWLGPKTDQRAPLASEQNRHIARPVWYIHPEAVRAESVGRPAVPIKFLLFPTYVPGAAPQLTPLEPGEAMRRLIENSVNFQRFGGGGLTLLSQLAQNAQSYDLIVNGPDQTARLIEQLWP